MKLTNNQKAILLLIFSVFLILGIIVLIKLLNIKKRDKKCIPITTCIGTDCSNGSDGCKGTCTCPDSKQCVEGKCVDCIPITTCTGTDCSLGSDNCKGTCTCPDSQKCIGGKCVDCIPTTTCTGYDCSVGSDGCKGTCTCPDSQQCVEGRCFNPLIQNMFVAVGMPYTFSQPGKPQNVFTGTMATSTNGIEWVPIPDQLFSKFATGIACNGLIWVVVGSSIDFSIAWSPNGNTWIKADNSYTNQIFSQGGIQVKWNGNLWVAVGVGDYSIAWSLDGKYWNGVKDSRNILSEGRGISWNGKNWIAVGGGEGTYSIATSEDGKNWKGVEDSSKLFVTANAVACNEKTCVVVGDITYGKTNNTIAWSLDEGFTWHGLDSERNIFSRANDVKWTGNTWIAVGEGVNRYGKEYPIAISPNGNDWTYIESFSGDFIKSIEWNENVWVFSTSNGIITSTDLTTFKRVPNILTKGALAISWW